MINLCKRAHAKGLKIMVGFHYSDSWADPEKQTIPAEWTDHSLEALCRNIYDHTYDVLSSLKSIGITPQWVQIGNEAYTGMLWETGRTGTRQGYKNFAAMINSGYCAIKDVDPGIQAIIHLPNAHNNKPVESNQFLVEFMRQLIDEGVLGCFFWEPESMGGYELGAWNPQTHQASIAMDAFKGIRHRERTAK